MADLPTCAALELQDATLERAATCYLRAVQRNPRSSAAACGLRRVHLRWQRTAHHSETTAWLALARVHLAAVSQAVSPSRTAAGRCVSAVVDSVAGSLVGETPAKAPSAEQRTAGIRNVATSGAPERSRSRRSGRGGPSASAIPHGIRAGAPGGPTPTVAAREEAAKLVSEGSALGAAGHMGEAIVRLSRAANLWPALHEAKLWWGLCESRQVRPIRIAARCCM